MSQTAIATWLRTDLDEISALIAGANTQQVETLGEALLVARRIFVTGQGRSGWIMRMAALRFMQIGLTVHVVGDATTPAIGPGDLLLIASGSGETPSPVAAARRARSAGARIALLTARPDSTLGSLADLVVHIPGETTKIRLEGTTRLPLAAALEQATLIVLDALVAWLAERRGENQATMMARHANLE
jgi:6-phospho-3-hexuloisomerase